jgi:hypothetical protein
MKITDAAPAWNASGVTLSSDEVWQVHDGHVVIDTDSTEANRLGIRLNPGDSLRISSGLTVYYRTASGTTALIARVAV